MHMSHWRVTYIDDRLNFYTARTRYPVDLDKFLQILHGHKLIDNIIKIERIPHEMEIH